MKKDKSKIESNNDETTLLPEVFGYHIFPPFIDAYLQSLYTGTHIPLEDIESKAKSHAWEWGEKVIGNSVLNGLTLPKHNDKIVLCCIYTYTGKDNDSYKNYLVVIDEFGDSWFNNLQFIEGDVSEAWDVT